MSAATIVSPTFKINDRVRVIKAGDNHFGKTGVVDQTARGFNTVLFSADDEDVYLDADLELVPAVAPVISFTPEHPATAFIRDLYEDGDYLCFMFLPGAEHWFVSREEATTPAFTAKLTAKNDHGKNVYIAMNVFKPGTTNRTIDNVAVVRHVWTEIDQDGRAKLDTIFASKLVPDPSVVLESSPNKYQFIWNVKDLAPADASVLGKALTAEFGGDPAATDLARVLRVPGFKNHKYPEQPVVEVVHLSEAITKRYTKFDFAISTAAQPTRKSDFAVSDARDEHGLIPHGSIHNHLVVQAGKLRQQGFPVEAIEVALVAWAHENCAAPIDEAKVIQVARSSANWEQGAPAPIVLLNGREPGTALAPTGSATPSTVEVVTALAGVPPESKTHGSEIEDMPDSVLSGRLGEVVQKRMSIFPIAYSWLSLVAQAGVFVPSNGPISWRSNLYFAPVGARGTGKTEALKYAQYLLGLKAEMDSSYTSRFLLDVMPSSGEGLLEFIGDTNGDPRVVNPEEMAFLLKRAALDGSSLPQMLDRAFNQTAFYLTKTRQRKAVFFNCRLTMVGGITLDHPDDFECVGQLFGASSLGGFFDRFCFGLNPSNSAYYYQPFSGGDAGLPTGSLQPVRFAEDIFEANKAWARELGGHQEVGRILEVALRVYGICAAFDGKQVLTAADIEKPIKAFVRYQKDIRERLQPNPGLGPDGQLTAAFLSYLRRHAPKGERCEIREMLRATNSYKHGSILCDRVINAMERNGEISTFYNTPAGGGRRKGWIWLTE